MPDGISLKIKRAKEHLRDLEIRISAFKALDPYAVVCEANSNTGERVFRVQQRHPIPPDIAIRIGEVLQNLRSALDYLVYSLVECNNGSPTRKTGFPIFQSAQAYEAKAGARTKIDGMSEKAMDAVTLFKPYKGGNDALWQLGELNNREKHRILVPTGIAYKATATVKMPFGKPVPIIAPAGIFRRRPTIVGWQRVVGLNLTPADGIFPIEDGAILDITPTKMNVYPTFTFEVAFNEPEIIQREAVLPTLHQLTDLVEGIVTAMRQWL